MADIATLVVLILAIGIGLGVFDILAYAFGEDSRDSYPDDHRRAYPGDLA